jgi:hypothetical protein
MTVYVPTLGRVEQVREQIIPAWLDQEMPIKIVTKGNEVDTYLKIRREDFRGENISIIGQPASVRGIGAVKRMIVNNAKRKNLSSIIIAEDDAVPNYDSNWCDLLDACERPDVIGIAGARAIHDFYTGGALRANQGTDQPVILYPGAAYVCYGLNIKNALAAGNYDAALHTCQDDAELPRQAIAKLGLPWMMHCDVWWHSLNKRYAPGGVNAEHADLAARQAAEDECRAIVHERWPKYMSPPGKKERMQWKRMLDDFIPDWKDRSAMHGGSLNW